MTAAKMTFGPGWPAADRSSRRRAVSRAPSLRALLAASRGVPLGVLLVLLTPLLSSSCKGFVCQLDARVLATLQGPCPSARHSTCFSVSHPKHKSPLPMSSAAGRSTSLAAGEPEAGARAAAATPAAFPRAAAAAPAAVPPSPAVPPSAALAVVDATAAAVRPSEAASRAALPSQLPARA